MCLSKRPADVYVWVVYTHLPDTVAGVYIHTSLSKRPATIHCWIYTYVPEQTLAPKVRLSVRPMRNLAETFAICFDKTGTSAEKFVESVDPLCKPAETFLKSVDPVSKPAETFLKSDGTEAGSRTYLPG